MEVSPLPPTPSQTKSETSSNSESIPSTSSSNSSSSGSAASSTAAGLARSLATNTLILIKTSSQTLVGLGKGLAKYWFKYPIKLFRPVNTSPFWLLRHLHGESTSAGSNSSSALIAIRRIVQQEGGVGVLVGKNMIPLLIANSLVGIVLFNSFTHTAALLKRLDGNSNLNLTEENTSSSSIHHPFTAGFVAGSAQALLSVPLSNLQRVIQPELLMLEKRQEGMLKVAWITLKTLLVPSSSSGVEEVIAHGRSTKHHGKYYKHITRFLYRDFAFNIAKDSIGFMLFFGVFETCRDFGKGLVKRTFDLKIAPPEATYSLYNPPLPILQQSSSSSNSVSFSSYSSSSSSSNSSFISKLPLALCNSAAVLASGAMAGLAYQSFSYPMDLIHAAIIHSKTIPTSSSSVTSTSAANLITAATHRDHHPLRHHHKHHDSSIRWSDVRNVIKEHGGIRPFFTGMQSHVLRAMPPSAIALFIYEVASHY